MAAEFKMPQLGLTMTEGTVLQWLKAIGDPIALGDILVEVETEKVNYQVESTLEGSLLEILVPEGDVAPVKAPLAIIGQPGEKVIQAENKEEKSVEVPSSVTPEISVAAAQEVRTGDRLKASPIAKRIAREQDISLDLVTGTGPDGRIVERDILKYLDEGRIKASPLAEKIAEEHAIDLAAIDKESRIMKDDVLAKLPQLSMESAQTDGVPASVPITGMRKVIAERMSTSWQTAPHVNMTVEIDMTAAADLKQKLTQALGMKVSYTDIIVKSTTQTLTEFPMVNSSLVDGKIVSHQAVNIGIAVALENGLIVPVLKDTNHKTIAVVHEEIISLSTKARNGELGKEEISGGTFTISNLGMFGIDHFTPIINQPESAILGVCRIVDRALVQDGAVMIRPMMNLCLSFDHRLIDGAVGAQFLARLRQLLEQPLLLL